jgi:hypothetical protein
MWARSPQLIRFANQGDLELPNMLHIGVEELFGGDPA